MSKVGEIFAGLTSAVVTAAALGGAVAFAYFYPFDSNQQTEKITEETKSQEVISKSEEKEIPTESSDTEDTSEQQIGVITNKSGSMIIYLDREQTKVFRLRKTQDEQHEQPPIEQKKEKPVSELETSELETLEATIDKKNKVLHVNSPCPTKNFKIKMAHGVTLKGWRKIAQYIQFKGDKELRYLFYNKDGKSALFTGDKVGNNYTPTLTVYWI